MITSQWIHEAIQKLLIDGEGEVFTRLHKLEEQQEIDGTQTKGYCYCIQLDNDGKPRTNDLIEYVLTKIVDYSIPKRKQDEARDYLNSTGSSSKIIELEKQAKALFVDLKNTGEFGEMILYILAQEILGLPQLISKMSLKTSGNVHYHGADGIHVRYENDGSLSLFWGESKMEKTITSALRNCFSSLKSFLVDPKGYSSRQARDINLITDHLLDNTNNKILEEFLVRYFDLNDDLSNKLSYKGVCFVGFDSSLYPKNPLEMKMNELSDLLMKNVHSWKRSIKTQIKNNLELEKFEIHMFLIPFPSVDDFRDHFIKVLGK